MWQAWINVFAGLWAIISGLYLRSAGYKLKNVYIY